MRGRHARAVEDGKGLPERLGQRCGEDLPARGSDIGLELVSEIGRAGGGEAGDDAAPAGVELVERPGEADRRTSALRIEVSAKARPIEVGNDARVQRQLDRNVVRLAEPVVDEDQARGAAELCVRGLGREGADASRNEQDRAAGRARRQRASIVRIGSRAAEMPLDRAPVRADDRADVDKRLVAGRPGGGNLLVVREGDVLQRRGRVARGHAQRRREDVTVRDGGDRDRVRRRSGRANGAKPPLVPVVSG